MKLLHYLIWTGTAVLLHLLFYKESLGLNVSIMAIMALGALAYQKRLLVKKPWFWIGVLFLAIPAVYNATAIGLVITIIAIIALVGLETEEVQQAIFGLSAGIGKLIRAPFSSNAYQLNITKKVSIRPGYFIIPIFLSLIFIGFYASGVPLFGELLDNLSEFAHSLFSRLFENFSPASILFFLAMLALSAFLFVPVAVSGAVKSEQDTSLVIRKKRHRLSSMGEFLQAFRIIPKATILALRHELRISTLSLGLLNFIILLALIAGFYEVLFPDLSKPAYLKVHEGTYTIIASLIAGSALVIYFFRGNLNFFSKSTLLKRLSAIWLGQNLLLALLDAIYNYKYIIDFGLTYKRLGVFGFLLMAIAGLAVVYVKLNRQYSTFKLIKLGLYCAVVFFAIVSPVNWDAVIVNYNLNRPGRKPSLLHYTVDLSYRSLPALIEKTELYDEYVSPEQGSYADAIEAQIIDYRSKRKESFTSSTLLKYEVDKAIKQYESTND